MDTYGWIQHLNGNSQAALPYLQGAAEGLPGDPIVQLHLGIVQAALGQADAAREQLRKGLDMLPEGQEGQSVTAARDALTRLDSPAAESQSGAPEGAPSSGTSTVPTPAEDAPDPASGPEAPNADAN